VAAVAADVRGGPEASALARPAAAEGGPCFSARGGGAWGGRGERGDLGAASGAQEKRVPAGTTIE